MKRLILSAVSAVIFSVLGCAAHAIDYRPMVDEEAIQDWGRYEQDLRSCQGYANQLSPANNAVKGAVAGAVLGAVIGAAIGDSGSFAKHGAGFGAATGAAQSAGGTYATQVNVVRNCMIGRGYMLLDAPADSYIGTPTSPAYFGQGSSVSHRCQVAPGSEGCSDEIAAAKSEEQPTKSINALVLEPDTKSGPSQRACNVAPGLAGCELDTKNEETSQ